MLGRSGGQHKEPRAGTLSAVQRERQLWRLLGSSRSCACDRLEGDDRSAHHRRNLKRGMIGERKKDTGFSCLSMSSQQLFVFLVQRRMYIPVNPTFLPSSWFPIFRTLHFTLSGKTVLLSTQFPPLSFLPPSFLPGYYYAKNPAGC